MRKLKVGDVVANFKGRAAAAFLWVDVKNVENSPKTSK
jgi:hypothetical protein